MSFFTELKRRNVFRVGFAYLVVSWFLLQIIDIVIPILILPDWVARFIFLLLAVGFIPVLIAAWAFELTPDGLKKEKDVDRSQSITTHTGRKLDRTIIVVLVLALGYFAYDKFSEKVPDSVSVSIPQDALQSTDTAVTEKTNPAPSNDDKSVAVLPFINMSDEAENEYFSDGISEEILNVLASIPNLKVAARTSAFAYKGTNTNISQIARELGVNHILEGSVRKSGNQVRITAQLIKADDGFHLWSANYDRELNNIFAIQDEIAGSIADELKVSLELEKGATGNLTGTISIDAYEYYLKGMSLWHQRTVTSLRQSIEAFGKAISLDPDFAKAYAGLALSWSVIEGYVTINLEESLKKAFTAAKKALSLDPDNVEAMVALGNIAKDKFQYAEALDYFEQAIKLNPSFATAYQWTGGLYLAMGNTEAALVNYQKAWDLDPRSRITGNNFAVTLQYLGRRQEATAMANQVFRFAPDFPEISKVLMHLAISAGDCKAAEQHGNYLASVLNKTFNATPVYVDICQPADPQARADAIKTMLSWPSLEFSSPDDATLSYPEDIVFMLVGLGEFEPAAILTERKRDYYSHIVLTRLRNDRSANGTRFYCDPRVQKLFEEAGIPPMEGENACE
jgi:TolB-like protein/Tfp pilus assembly protein PilF